MRDLAGFGDEAEAEVRGRPTSGGFTRGPAMEGGPRTGAERR
jgi:hypothetical protein